MEKWLKKVIDLDELYYFYLDTIFIWKATKKKVGGSPADLVKKPFSFEIIFDVLELNIFLYIRKRK